MIQFNCDCGQKLKVDDKYAGKKIRCPKCKAVTLVPPDGDLSDVMSAPLGDMKSPESEEFDFKTLPKLKSLDDLVDLEDVADDDEDEEGGAAAPPPPASSKIMMVLGVLFALIGLGGAIGTGMVLIPSALADVKRGGGDMPNEFDVYTAEGSVMFSMKYPKGWKLESGGGTGGVQAWVKVSGQGCIVDFRTSTSGAAVGGYGVNIQPDKMNELEPVHQIHESAKAQLMSEDSSYEESSPELVKTGFGSSRLSKYSRGGILWGEYGYRLTAFANENWNGKAYCTSESKFNSNEALLRDILLSISMSSLKEEKPAAPAAPAPPAEAAPPAVPAE